MTDQKQDNDEPHLPEGSNEQVTPISRERDWKALAEAVNDKNCTFPDHPPGTKLPGSDLEGPQMLDPPGAKPAAYGTWRRSK